MSPRILIVVQHKLSRPGRIGRLLRKRGFELDKRWENLPPNLDGHQAAVVFGGPMSANDDSTRPFIRHQLDWLEMAIHSAKPVLGICLGAQLMARALGARVTKDEDGRSDIGYYPVRPAAGWRDRFDGEMHFYRWNSEGFEVPRGAELLATGDAFPNQAFRYNATAYGLQFHPEVTRGTIVRWTAEPERLSVPGAQSREVQLRHHARHNRVANRWLEDFLEHWLASPPEGD